MLRVRAVTPLEGRSVRLTLSDGTDVERDLTDLLDGPVFVGIAAEDAVFRRVRAIDGTLVWPGDVDIAPETLIWDGPDARRRGDSSPRELPSTSVAEPFDTVGGRLRDAGARGCGTCTLSE